MPPMFSIKVAKLAVVSSATVSRTIDNKDRVRKQTRKCVSRQRQDSLAVHDPLPIWRKPGIQLMHALPARHHESHR